jgi:hypothetical protein
LVPIFQIFYGDQNELFHSLGGPLVAEKLKKAKNLLIENRKAGKKKKAKKN